MQGVSTEQLEQDTDVQGVSTEQLEQDTEVQGVFTEQLEQQLLQDEQTQAEERFVLFFNFSN